MCLVPDWLRVRPALCVAWQVLAAKLRHAQEVAALPARHQLVSVLSALLEQRCVLWCCSGCSSPRASLAPDHLPAPFSLVTPLSSSSFSPKAGALISSCVSVRAGRYHTYDQLKHQCPNLRVLTIKYYFTDQLGDMLVRGTYCFASRRFVALDPWLVPS
jgi:hypothetical protein